MSVSESLTGLVSRDAAAAAAVGCDRRAAAPRIEQPFCQGGGGGPRLGGAHCLGQRQRDVLCERSGCRQRTTGRGENRLKGRGKNR